MWSVLSGESWFTLVAHGMFLFVWLHGVDVLNFRAPLIFHCSNSHHIYRTQNLIVNLHSMRYWMEKNDFHKWNL